jgi:hypothetical protein
MSLAIRAISAASGMPRRPHGGGRPLNQRSNITTGKRLLPGVHRQSPSGRRFLDLYEAFVADAGGHDALSEHDRILTRAAAASVVHLEAVQADILTGKPVDTSELVKLNGEVRRLLSRLKRKEQPPSVASLRDYLGRETVKPKSEAP